jgi:CBS-domain-containing membrane protein
MTPTDSAERHPGTGRATDVAGSGGGHDATMFDGLRTHPDAPLSVGTVMTPFPVVVNLDTPLEEVAEQLSQNDITGAPVVDADGFLVGVISQTDLVRTAAAGTTDGRGWVGFTARHVMTRTPVKARADLPLADAVRRLERHGVHRLIIVADDDVTPIGIVSISDLLPLLVDAAEL